MLPKTHRDRAINDYCMRYGSLSLYDQIWMGVGTNFDGIVYGQVKKGSFKEEKCGRRFHVNFGLETAKKADGINPIVAFGIRHHLEFDLITDTQFRNQNPLATLPYKNFGDQYDRLRMQIKARTGIDHAEYDSPASIDYFRQVLLYEIAALNLSRQPKGEKDLILEKMIEITPHLVDDGREILSSIEKWFNFSWHESVESLIEEFKKMVKTRLPEESLEDFEVKKLLEIADGNEEEILKPILNGSMIY